MGHPGYGFAPAADGSTQRGQLAIVMVCAMRSKVMMPYPGARSLMSAHAWHRAREQAPVRAQPRIDALAADGTVPAVRKSPVRREADADQRGFVRRGGVRAGWNLALGSQSSGPLLE
jgi:hypothetical protein